MNCLKDERPHEEGVWLHQIGGVDDTGELELHLIDEVMHRAGLPLFESGDFLCHMSPWILRIRVGRVDKAEMAVPGMSTDTLRRLIPLQRCRSTLTPGAGGRGMRTSRTTWMSTVFQPSDQQGGPQRFFPPLRVASKILSRAPKHL